MLRYPGSKLNVRAILDEHVPAEVTSVAAPFFGGGAYEFHLARRGVHVVGADINGPLVNFWNMCRQDVSSVADMVVQLGAGLDNEGFHRLRHELMTDPGTNSIRAASAFFVLNRTSYNGIMRYYSPNAGRFTPSCVTRLRQLQWPPSLQALEHCDAFEFMERHRDKFWFLDPPYYKVKGGLYGLNADEHRFDHERLAAFLQCYPDARWVLTYDDTPVIRSMYESFATIRPLRVQYGCRHTIGREIIITPGKKCPD